MFLSTVERRKPTLPLNSSRSPAILKGCQPTVLLPIVIFGVRMLQFESCLPVKDCRLGEVGTNSPVLWERAAMWGKAKAAGWKTRLSFPVGPPEGLDLGGPK